MELTNAYTSLTKSKLSSLVVGDTVYIKRIARINCAIVEEELMANGITHIGTCDIPNDCRFMCRTCKIRVEGYKDGYVQVLCKFRLFNKNGKQYE